MSYTKYHETWATTDVLSGASFSHIETQWDDMILDVGSHSHDDRYYTKTLANSTFFSIFFYTGFDADKIDGKHYTDLVAVNMPLGVIMMWSGDVGDIPTGWHVSDGGTYGGKVSPDLRNRFVICAGGTYAVNDKGGPATYNATVTPTGNLTVGAHTVTTAELPPHTHSYEEYYSPRSMGDNAVYSLYNSISTTTRSIEVQDSGDGSHGHTGSTIVFNAIDTRPVFYSLYYIFKYE